MSTVPQLVTVVVPARNSAATLGRQLDSLAAQSYDGPWEVLVVDNCSLDATASIGRRWAERLPSFRLVRAPDRPNPAYARNAGAREAGGDLLAFCDADDAVAPGWLEALARALPHGDVFGGPCEEGLLNDPAVRTWREPQPADRFPMALDFLPYAGTGGCAVRTSVFEALGGFNEAYDIGEDVELSWRAQLAGYRLCFVPDARVHYRHRGSLGRYVRQCFAYGRASPHLYRDFRSLGVPRRSMREALWGWMWLLLTARDLAAGRAARGRWLGSVAEQMGCVAGSVRHRVMFL